MRKILTIALLCVASVLNAQPKPVCFKQHVDFQKVYEYTKDTFSAIRASPYPCGYMHLKSGIAGTVRYHTSTWEWQWADGLIIDGWFKVWGAQMYPSADDAKFMFMPGSRAEFVDRVQLGCRTGIYINSGAQATFHMLRQSCSLDNFFVIHSGGSVLTYQGGGGASLANDKSTYVLDWWGSKIPVVHCSKNPMDMEEKQDVEGETFFAQSDIKVGDLKVRVYNTINTEPVYVGAIKDFKQPVAGMLYVAVYENGRVERLPVLGK